MASTCTGFSAVLIHTAPSLMWASGAEGINLKQWKPVGTIFASVE